MWRHFRIFSSDDKPKTPPTRGLPASWYRSPEMYQLERRAIFSRRWIIVTNSLRFNKAGDFISFTQAGVPFFLVRDRNGKINGFHNICRHRAYPVVQSRSGTVSILRCKYHDWSYGFKGNLSKAPKFDIVTDFDKDQHGLIPIQVHVDRDGFVWVNLQAGEPDLKWKDDFEGVDEQPKIQQFDFAEEFTFDHYWEMDVDANWKALVDNYNECYHCPTSHPLIAGVSDLEKYRVVPKAGHMEHRIVNKDQGDGQFHRGITFFYPSTSITVTEHFFYIQRMLPVTATTSRIEYEVFRHRNATDEDFENITAFYRQVLEEDKQLWNAAQKNLNVRVFVNGELHPEKGNGPIHFQNNVRKDVTDHRKKEEQQGGQEIWPAMPKLIGEMKTCKLEEEELFCSQLEKTSYVANLGLTW